MQIHEAGGGIHFSVNHTKNASEEILFNSLKERLNNFVTAG
jgi:imidazolonepropionase